MDTQEVEAVVRSLRAAGKDSARVEAKSTAEKIGKSLWPTISAFSNTKGGLIVLGLDEAAGFGLVPNFRADIVAQQVVDGTRSRGMREDRGPLTPTPNVEVDRMDFEGGQLVIVTVHELEDSQKPCFVTAASKENGSYKRLDDGDYRMDTHEVFLMTQLSIESPADHAPVMRATGEDLDPDLVRRLLDNISKSRPRVLSGATTDAQALERLGVMDRDTGKPTLAGLLSLGMYPQQFFPQLMISFAAYPGRNKSDVQGPEQMTDRAVLEGAIPDMVDDAVAVIRRNLRTRRVGTGAGRADRLEIPLPAIREALVNAITHRDYSSYALGDQVLVELYPDRLVIRSPGGLWGGRRIETIEDGRSRSRNTVLSKLLMDVTFRDRDESLCENAGSGIPRMLGEMTNSGLPAPKFSSGISEFVVQLDRFGLLNPEVNAWLQTLPGPERTHEQDCALTMMRNGEIIVVAELRRQLGVDTTVAQAALDGLERTGLVSTLMRGEYWLSYSRAASPVELGENERKIVDALEKGGTVTLKALAGALDVTPASLRPRMKRLIERGVIEATAPATSRHRAYRLPTPK